MGEELRQGVISNLGLDPEVYENVSQLAELCNNFDHITLKINEDMLRTRDMDTKNDFLYYHSGVLVGFLGLYQFSNHEIEISGMVHPNYRRRGVFSQLLEVAKKEIQHRGISNLVFINEHDSSTGKSFLESLGAQYTFSEYWMKMLQVRLPDMRHPVVLRSSNLHDIKVVANMTAVCFDKDESELLETMTKRWKRKEDRDVRFLIELNGNAIGTLAINYSDKNSAFIYGFCVLPEHQGRGYGRQALALAIQIALDHHCLDIELEVACENTQALSLYQSCGFDVLRANDYYVKTMDTLGSTSL